MIDACRKNNVNLMVGQVLRYFPIHAKVKELVDSGELGRLLCLTIYRLGGGFTGVWAKEWRKSKALSGGMVFGGNIQETFFFHSFLFILKNTRGIYLTIKNFR